MVSINTLADYIESKWIMNKVYITGSSDYPHLEIINKKQ